VTSDYLKEFNVRPGSHPPYSPNLALSDFSLFGAIKGKTAGSEFRSAEQLLSEVAVITTFIPHITLANVSGEWEQRLQMRIDMEGDYLD
jgi:hypothetical protein